MSFIDYEPELSDSIFTPENLQWARRILLSGITTHDPSWLKNPQGPLGARWQASNDQSSCYLIDFARMVHTIGCRIDSESAPIFVQKVNRLLRPKSNRLHQFEENLTELEVADLLMQVVIPLHFEPLANGEAPSSGRQKSPDFCFTIASGVHWVEVTVLHVKLLDTWHTSAKKIEQALFSKLLAHGANRNIAFELSLRHRMASVATIIDTRMVKEILASEFGETVIPLTEGHLKIGWRSTQQFVVPDSNQIPIEIANAIGPGTIVSNMPMEIGPNVYMAETMRIGMDSDDMQQATELIVKSIRNTLNRKREQHVNQGPYILVIRAAHPLLHDSLQSLIESRIWPNNQYKWLTCIGLYTPRQAYRSAAPQTLNCPSIVFTMNPNAEFLASDGLVETLGGKPA